MGWRGSLFRDLPLAKAHHFQLVPLACEANEMFRAATRRLRAVAQLVAEPVAHRGAVVSCPDHLRLAEERELPFWPPPVVIPLIPRNRRMSRLPLVKVAHTV